MQRYTNGELADMHFVYGIAEGNGRAAERIYRERFPDRHQPHHSLFARVHRNLCNYGSLRSSRTSEGRPRSTCSVVMEESVLDAVETNPSTSIRAVASALRVSRCSVQRVLNGELLHAFHLQRVQVLLPDDHPARVRFVQWYLQQSVQDVNFPAYVLFTDEATFNRDGVFNQHNAHLWAHENPHGVRQHAAQHRFAINVWAGLVGDCLVGPYLLPSRMTTANYRIFLKHVLPGLLDDVPLSVRRNMWFQHDGAPAHFGLAVRRDLNRSFPQRWIGRGGPVPWPPRSPDLSSLDFFLWGALKAIVYHDPVESEMDLVARLVCAAATIKETPGVFDRVRQSMLRRCQACLVSDGANFEHLL